MMQTLSLKACVSYSASFRVYETKAHEHTWLKVQILSTNIGHVLTD